MAEITTTRTALRQALCQELHMPFVRRTNSHSHPAASPAPTTTSISDTLLAQNEDIWIGQWFYNITKDECRRIIAFDTTLDTIKFEYPATLPLVTDEYEIHSIWNAFELHGAINRAIEDAFPAFFDYVIDETLVFKETTLKYDITALTSPVWRMMKIWAEHNETQISGTATSGTTGTLVDSHSPFTNVVGKTGWLVSIYAGTGAGQLRTVNATGTTATTIVPTAVFTTAPDTTSKYKVWDPNTQTIQWEPLVSVDFDAKEYPNYIYFTRDFPESLGLRMRLEYIARPAPLTTEAGTTCVPKEFIINKALSILFGQKVNDNRADRNRFANLEEYRRQLAEQYRTNRAFQVPDSTVWQPSRNPLVRGYQEVDPF